MIDAGSAGRPRTAAAAPAERAAEREPCDYCGALSLEWRKCKLICRTCSQINKSCADL